MNRSIENIKILRVKMGLSTLDIANFLGIKESAYKAYEKTDKDINLFFTSKLAYLYGVELYDIIECDLSNREIHIVKSKEFDFSTEDLKSISRFNVIINNYLKMNNILNSVQ
jgi:predicted transcriptional regulator